MYLQKLTLFALLVCSTSIVQAQNAWHDEVLSVAHTFSELNEKQMGIEYSISYMHPQVLSVVANQMGETPDGALAMMRAGYASSTAALETKSHNVFPENAVFGEANGQRWGAVPNTAEMALRTNGNPLPQQCSWLLVFEDEGRWFFNSVNSGSARTRAMLGAALPPKIASVAAELGTPSCIEPSVGS